MYIIKVLEREPSSNNSKVLFSKKIPVPFGYFYYETEVEFSEYIKSLDLPWHIRDAYLAQIYYVCHQWFGKNFYSITWEDDEL
jgi:hypothetical protein